ncbi:Ypd1p NDAI_0H03970 [Naumovozyma dairenensis CBS 421]|uniref:Phosphorelay intermediate protein YPD1 n=1 Tax=Naumovozyma dairenensis (strain ATCC 10597 / BCRC 20456 / CBS 421 / NBRC 0211 / NRRL Y-12639) TaxID=1071378 RepID=G0WFK9_NAUDC|nr:hypothetical protein NDAI_0H03970 [Naumovozyma dairenensis CBS 421]CCD26570.1 hypothetical protein NDAI_0H03970 [Naumovozyma dairenensis CBS 421]
MMPHSIPQDIINWTILNEIISMDDDDPDFSKQLIIQYIDQAETVFNQIEEHLQSTKDLTQLDSLGHFLKGSSAALGLQRIAWVCERIQNLGRKLEDNFPNQKDLLKGLPKDTIIPECDDNQDITLPNDDELVDKNNDKDNKLYILLITKALRQARLEFKLAINDLSKYYKTDLFASTTSS